MTNTYSFNQLFDFIDVAERNRKYPLNTAAALKAALRLFEQELSDDEKKDINLFKNRLDQIYQNVLTNNQKTMSSSSIETYKVRVNRVLREFEQYGKDPTKMNNWKPTTRKRTIKSKTEKISQNQTQEDSTELSSQSNTSMTRFELNLRQGDDVKAVILTPSDLTRNEAEKIKSYVDFLISTIDDEDNN